MSVFSSSQAAKRETTGQLLLLGLNSTMLCGHFTRPTFVQRGLFVLAADVWVGACLQEALDT